MRVIAQSDGHTPLRCVAPRGLIWILMVMLFAYPSVRAQQRPEREPQTSDAGAKYEVNSTERLQRASENTVASVMSVPIEGKSNFNIGPYSRMQNLINIKPLIPMQLSKKWRVIARIIQPIQWQPYTSRTEGGKFGLGDMNPTFFLSPVPRGKLAWGDGPTFIVPTATDRILGQGKLSIGPELAVFLQPGHWTVGTLISNVWSVAGSGGRRNVNQMQLQYFLTYRLKNGWEVETSPIITADWKSSGGNVWTIPLGGGLGKMVHINSRPAKVGAKFYSNVVRPSGASTWGMRLQTEFLFPKREE